MVTVTEIIDFIAIHYDWLSLFVIILVFSLLSMRYFRNKKKDREPIILLLIAVGLGVISVVPSLLLSIILLLFIPQSYGTIVVAPIAEEIGKGMFVGIIAWTRLIDDPLDGLVYGAMVGTGFAAAENFLYAYQALTTQGLVSGIFVVSFRSAFQIIGHPLYAGVTGYGIGLYKKGLVNHKYGKIWYAMILHALWNTTSIIAAQYWLISFVGVLLFSIIILRIIISRAQVKS